MERPVFFCHIMKTAGTSLLHMLDAALGDRLYPSAKDRSENMASDETTGPVRHYYHKSTELVRLVGSGELSLEGKKLVIGHHPWVVGHAIFDNPIMATFLREPVARTMSMVDHWIRLHTPHLTPEELLWSESFCVQLLRDTQVRAFASGRIMRGPDRRPMGLMQFAEPIDDKAFALALKRLEATEFVGLAERFSESVALFSRKTGIELSAIPEVRTNLGNWKPPSDEMRKRILSLVPYDLQFYEAARTRFERDVRQ